MKVLTALFIVVILIAMTISTIAVTPLKIAAANSTSISNPSKLQARALPTKLISVQIVIRIDRPALVNSLLLNLKLV
jgi:hypothetical protein